MTVGTKSLLVGAHQFVLHPIAVCMAWINIYGWSSLSIKKIICIIIHDWGYFGKPNMDGAEGVTHPELGARIAEFLFGYAGKQFTAGHSKSYSNLIGLKPSELYGADKLAFCYHNKYLYLKGIKLSGEYKEYLYNYLKKLLRKPSYLLTFYEWKFLDCYEELANSGAKGDCLNECLEIWYNHLYQKNWEIGEKIRANND